LQIYRPKFFAVIWLLGIIWVSVISQSVLSKSWLETGFLALLPETEQQPEIASVVKRHNDLFTGKVIFLTGSNTAEKAIVHAKRLNLELVESQLFKKIGFQSESVEAIQNYQQLFKYRYQLLDAETRKNLQQQPEILLQQNLQMLYSPVGQLAALQLEKDPLLLFQRYFSTQNPKSFHLEQGMIILQDGQRFWALQIAHLHDDKLSLDKLTKLVDVISRAKEQIQTSGGELKVTGMPLFTADGSQSAQKEITTVGIGSTVGIMLLLMLTFRSIRPLVLSCLAIAASTFVALIISLLLFNKIHMLTLVFGASLIGVGIDYSLHYFCNSFSVKDWSPRHGLYYIFLGITLDLATSLISYASLGISPFPLLQEIAVFSLIGLTAAWLTVVLLFPFLLSGFKPAHYSKLLMLTNYWQQHWSSWTLKNRNVLIVGLLIFTITGIWQLTPKDDVRLLQSASAELVKTDTDIRKLLPHNTDSQFFVVSGKNETDWFQKEQQLLQYLATLKNQHALQDYDGLTKHWFNFEIQQENYQFLRKNLYDSGLLQHYMKDLGFNALAILNEQKQFNEAKSNTLSLSDWLKHADESKRMLWFGCDANHCQSVVTLTGIKDLNALHKQNLSGVYFIDQANSISDLFSRYRANASFLLIIAYLLVFIGLALKFGWKNGFMIIAVPVFSTVMSLAALGWCNQLFSLFNLFALLLVLGIGVDYGIFFFLAENKRESTSLAVTLSALTTLLSFGLLTVSKTEIVHAFGFTVAVGILTAWLIAPLVRQE
jgi:predicted exporter